MFNFKFLNNAYWVIDSINNICYIRTVGFENAEAIIEKYDKITQEPNWNNEITLVNDYEDLIGVKLFTSDIMSITDFHKSILNRLGTGNWYFITSHMLYYGIIRMYAMYVNYFNGPTIIPIKYVNELDDYNLRSLIGTYRRICIVQEKKERLDKTG
jgi:hypothetical protein